MKQKNLQSSIFNLQSPGFTLIGLPLLRKRSCKCSSQKGFTLFSLRERGFTLIEAIVVITVLAIIGLVVADLLSKGFKGNNKTIITGNLKQNGQTLLNILEDNIRNAENIVCIGNRTGSIPADTLNSTIVVLKNGTLNRFRFYSPSATANGFVAQDSPALTPNADITSYASLCSEDYPVGTILTDINTFSGISVEKYPGPNPSSPSTLSEDNIFYQITSGGKDIIQIKFRLKPGISAAASFDNTLDPVLFQTTVQLR